MRLGTFSWNVNVKCSNDGWIEKIKIKIAKSELAKIKIAKTRFAKIKVAKIKIAKIKMAQI